MKAKDTLADTFLDEVRKFKGPLKRVPENYLSTKLINEIEIGKMDETEKKIFTISLNRSIACEKLKNSVGKRKATKEERRTINRLDNESACIRNILLDIIELRLCEKISKYPNDFRFIFKSGYKIAIGRPDKADPITISFNNYSTFSTPMMTSGVDMVN